MKISLFYHDWDNTPHPVDWEWGQLVQALAEYKSSVCTLSTCKRSNCPNKKIQAWSPASWPEGAKREKRSVESVWALVIDVDHVLPENLEEKLERFSDYSYVMHSSHSDSPSDRCVRLVLQLSRPVAGRQWERFWKALVKFLGIQETDERCKDASRIYYLPSRPSDASVDAFDGSGFDYCVNEGRPIDVDLVLALVAEHPVIEPKPVKVGSFRDAPSPGNYQIAVEVLGKNWPTKGRHQAHLALSGALARAGWPVDLIAQFCGDVAELQEPGNRLAEKRHAAARSSLAKITSGEMVVGWPTLEQYVGREVISTATRALGLSLDDDPKLLETMIQAAKRRSALLAPGGTPTRLEVRAALERARDKVKNSSDVPQRLEGKLLTKVLKGQHLTDHIDEDRERALAQAVMAVINAVPENTPKELITEVLLGPAGALAADVSDYVDDGLEFVRKQRSEQAADSNGDLPEPQNDDALREQLATNDKGGVFNCGSNIERILRYSKETRGYFRFNLLTKQIEVTGGRFQSEALNDLPTGLKNWMSSRWGLMTSTSEVAEQVLRAARRWNSYDPVVDYLTALQWDGRPRIGDPKHSGWLTKYCGVQDSLYVRKVGWRFLISAIARALDPGCKVDSVLILEGRQGAKKSTTIGILGGSWFTDTPIVIGDKDSRILAASKWIVEMAELSSMAKGESEAYKAFFSQKYDDFRPPYGKAMESFPRRCVFFGSTNEFEYLEDMSGNRRYWAVQAGLCDDEALELDRDQLWAEAVYRYRSAELHPDQKHRKCPGERWWFEPDEQIEADLIIQERLLDNPWVLKIQEWVDRMVKPTGARSPRTHFDMSEIAEQALNLSVSEMDRFNKKIGKALRAAGMEPIRHNGKRVWRKAGLVVLGQDVTSVRTEGMSAHRPEYN